MLRKLSIPLCFMQRMQEKSNLKMANVSFANVRNFRYRHLHLYCASFSVTELNYFLRACNCVYRRCVLMTVGQHWHFVAFSGGIIMPVMENTARNQRNA